MKTKTHTGDSPLLFKEGPGVVKIIFLCATICLAFSACHTTKTTTSSSQQLEVKDSTVVTRLNQQIDSLTAENSRIYTKVFERAIEFSTRFQGSTGDKDTTCNIPIREKQLNIGDDYIKVRGQWHFLDYEIYKAPRESTKTVIRDSSSTSSDQKNSSLQDKLNYVLNTSKEETDNSAQEIIYRVPFKFYIYSAAAVIAAFLGGMLVCKIRK